MPPNESAMPPVKRPRLEPIIRAILIIGALMVCAVIVLAAFGLRSVAKATSSGQSELERLKAEGKPLTPAEAAPKPVPADQNAAPLYLQAADALAPDKKSQSAMDDQLTGANWNDSAAMAKFRDLVASHQSALRLVHAGAERPYFRSNVKWTAGLDATFPHYSRLRFMARFLSAATAVSAREGRQAEALQILRDGFRMSGHVSQEPCLIGQLASYAIDAILMRSAEYAVSRGELPAKEAHALADDLGRVDFYGAMQRAMDMERAWGLQVYADPSLMDRRGEQGSQSTSPPQESVPAGEVAAHGPLRILTQADQSFYLRGMRQYETEAAVPWREIAAKTDRIDPERDTPRYFYFSRIMLFDPTRSFANRDETLARRSILQAVLGLEVWRQQHGQYPTSLADLRNIGWPVPADPFSGADFVYKVSAGKYLLYSIGRDLTDDGGTPINRLLPRALQKKSAEDAGDLGDIPWMPWRKDVDYSYHFEGPAIPPTGK
jgi:hypothetical protein